MAKRADIPFVDLAGQHATLKDELLLAFAGVLDHGLFVMGPEVEAFEIRFAELCGTSFAVSLNSGFDALSIALQALGIGPGDEVITAPNSHIATASAIALLGATPVFVDVRDDFNIDPEAIEAAITERTRALVPVHLTGRPAAMTAIEDIARRYEIHVVEDASQSVCAAYKGKRTGSFGTIGAFSLHPLKTLGGCGDAGIATTNDPTLRDRMISLRNHGLKGRDECLIWGRNSRLDSVQAAVLDVKLTYLEKWVALRRRNAALYIEGLKEIADLILPIDRPHECSVYHTFIIQTGLRDDLRQYLAAEGIGTAIHYPVPIHLQPASAALGYGVGAFPVAERQADTILSLPVHEGVGEDDVALVIRHIKEFFSAT